MDTWSEYFGALLIVIALVALLRPAETLKWNAIGTIFTYTGLIALEIFSGRAAWPVGW